MEETTCEDVDTVATSLSKEKTASTTAQTMTTDQDPNITPNVSATTPQRAELLPHPKHPMLANANKTTGPAIYRPLHSKGYVLEEGAFADLVPRPSNAHDVEYFEYIEQKEMEPYKPDEKNAVLLINADDEPEGSTAPDDRRRKVTVVHRVRPW